MTPERASYLQRLQAATAALELSFAGRSDDSSSDEFDFALAKAMGSYDPHAPECEEEAVDMGMKFRLVVDGTPWRWCKTFAEATATAKKLALERALVVKITRM
mgnify:CR=1 FL=1